VAAQIVEQGDIVRPPGRRQHLFDIAAEALAGDGAIKDTGAVTPLQRKPATKVVTFQCPCRTGATKRKPRAARP
jgi:hypothetical protein